MLNTEMVELIVCPIDKLPMHFLESENCFINPRLKLRYEVDGDIPVLLPESGASLTAQDLKSLLDS